MSVHIKDEDLINIAKNTAKFQTERFLDEHINSAKELCKELGIVVCDCYAIWKKLYESGVKEILIVVTHGIFSGEKWQKLFDYGVTKIITTNSIPSAKEKASDKIIILPVSSLLTGIWK